MPAKKITTKKVSSKKIEKPKKPIEKKGSAKKTPKPKGRKNIDALLPPRGMHDVLPSDSLAYNRVVNVARQIGEFYGFSEIKTPILEKVDLFTKGVGENTDIVEKEMYTLRTKGGDRLALRPEGTAPVVRAYLQHGMHKLPQPQKFYYAGPFFRHERPQAGRYRQLRQFGLEIVGGDSDPVYDAQIMTMFYRILQELKLGELMIHINSIGCRSCRPGYNTKLISYYKENSPCNDCERRIKSNPLRLLDCKKEPCQPIKAGAPNIFDSLCSLCRNHLKQVLENIEEINLPYTLNPLLVRGLDYYNRTVFEIFSEENDLALAGGGRYDYLAEMIGGRSTSAGGAALGIDRVVEVMRESNPKAFDSKDKKKVYLVHIGDLAKKKSMPILEDLRTSNIHTTTSFSKSSLSNQLDAANKAGVQLVLILGQKEVYEESIMIRNMETGVQETVPITKVIEEVRKRLKS